MVSIALTVSLLFIAWQHSASSQTFKILCILVIPHGKLLLIIIITRYNKKKRNRFILKIWFFLLIHHRNDNNKTHRFKCSKCFVIFFTPNFIWNFVLLISFGVKAIIWMGTSFVMQMMFIVLCPTSYIHSFGSRCAKNEKLIISRKIWVRVFYKHCSWKWKSRQLFGRYRLLLLNRQ